MKNACWKSRKIVWMAMVITFVGITVAVAKGPGGGGGGKPSGETAGNNLSFPVIWAEGVSKALPGWEGMNPLTQGEWWYQWGTNGTDPDIFPASCRPDDEAELLLVDRFYCDDGLAGKLTIANVKDCPIDPDGPDSFGFEYCDDQITGDLSGIKIDCPLGYDPDGRPLVEVSYYCDDGAEGTVDRSLEAGTPAADNPQLLVKAYIQKDPLNVWQAGSADWRETPVEVDWIDWGDNLESVDWYTRSQVRTEVVLFQDLDDPMTEYQMRHVDGWGIDEVHGMAVSLSGDSPIEGPGDQATVYSPCARLTIQKLLVPRDDLRLADLIWAPGEGWSEPPLFDKAIEYYEDDVVRYDEGVWVATNDIPANSVPPDDNDNWEYKYPAKDLVNPHIFNLPVWGAGDGPGYYNAEINVKGRIIYGYTWNVRNLNDAIVNGGTAAGDYRITFSFDAFCGTTTLNTYFIEGVTEILVPLEEELTAAALAEESESTEGGAIPELDYANNLTYIDVRILERSGGGGGGGKPKTADNRWK